MCLGKGVGGGCVVVVFLALVAARRESERASERQRRGERAREREEPRSRFRGSTFRRNRCCRHTHRQRKEVIASKGGKPASEVRFPGVSAGGGSRGHAVGFVLRWVTGCNLP